MDPNSLRFASPACLIGSLFLFVLPWINVRCSAPDGQKIEMSQSGVQAAIGKATIRIENKDGTVMTFSSGEQPPGGGGAMPMPGQNDGPDPAPLLILFGLSIVAGAVAGFVVREPRTRRFAVAGAAGVAVLLLVVQLAVGFPLLDGMPQDGPFEIRYTIWFWLTWLTTLAAAGLAMLEHYQEAVRSRYEWDSGEPLDDVPLR
ncbi:MAG: hypothetical protein KY476_05715 [Planctomycetes bacterium]|nr:hypothetical protein [Planctomycetota bacterium]